MGRWVVDHELGRLAPKAGGLYAIYLDGALSYIGQTGDLRARLRSHALAHSQSIGRWQGMKFSCVSVKICLHTGRFGSRVEREKALICRLDPPLNHIAPTGKDYRDLAASTYSGMHLEYG